MTPKRSDNAPLPMRVPLRGIVTGAIIGAVVGIVVAFVVHEIFASDASLWVYEIPGI